LVQIDEEFDRDSPSQRPEIREVVSECADQPIPDFILVMKQSDLRPVMHFHFLTTDSGVKLKEFVSTTQVVTCQGLP